MCVCKAGSVYPTSQWYQPLKDPAKVIPNIQIDELNGWPWGKTPIKNIHWFPLVIMVSFFFNGVIWLPAVRPESKGWFNSVRGVSSSFWKSLNPLKFHRAFHAALTKPKLVKVSRRLTLNTWKVYSKHKLGGEKKMFPPKSQTISKKQIWVSFMTVKENKILMNILRHL